MRCYSCGNEFIERTGSLELPSKILGSFLIDHVTYLKCSHCQEIILSDEAWERADATENSQVEKLLRNLPVKDFIGASKTAAILEISRQALHKHRRIRRGFIYSIRHEDKILYHKKSVQLFKETGDGRFPLKKEGLKREKEYVLVTVGYHSPRTRFHDYGNKTERSSWKMIPQNTLPTQTGRIYG